MSGIVHAEVGSTLFYTEYHSVTAHSIATDLIPSASGIDVGSATAEFRSGYFEGTIFFYGDQAEYIRSTGNGLEFATFGNPELFLDNVNLRPSTNNDIDLGHSNYKWKYYYGYNIYLGDYSTAGPREIILRTSNNQISRIFLKEFDDIHGGGIVYDGANNLLKIQMYDTGTITREAIWISRDYNEVHPGVTDTFDFGTSTHKWKDIHLSGNLLVGGLVDSVDIAGFKSTYDAHDHSSGDPTQVAYGNLTGVPGSFTPITHTISSGYHSGNLAFTQLPAGAPSEWDLDASGGPFIIRTTTNPSSGEAIFEVRSSGNAIRLAVDHDGEVYTLDMFNADEGYKIGGTTFLNANKVLQNISTLAFDLIPDGASTRNIGSPSFEYHNIYLGDAGTIFMWGDQLQWITATDTQVHIATEGTVRIAIEWDNLMPAIANWMSLGASVLEFKNLYLAGTIFLWTNQDEFIYSDGTYLRFGVGGSDRWRMTTTAWGPVTDNQYDLGTTSYSVRHAYIGSTLHLGTSEDVQLYRYGANELALADHFRLAISPANIKASGDIVIADQDLGASNQHDVILFGDGANAQAGAYQNYLRIFGGSGQTRHLQLYQAVGGDAYVISDYASLVLRADGGGSSGIKVVISDGDAFFPSVTNNVLLGTETYAFKDLWARNWRFKDPPVNNSYYGVTIEGVAAVALVIGDVVYYNSSGQWAKADADAESTAKGRLGMACESISASGTGTILLFGVIRHDDWAWTTAQELWISVTPGDPTATKPTGSGDIVRLVGHALDADAIFFDPDQTYIEIA